MSKTHEQSIDRLIHDIEVTDENVGDMLHTEIFRLMHKYGSRVRDELFAIAIGPNAFKALQHWSIKRQSFSMARGDGMNFHGVRVVCGPLPFFVPLFTESGWRIAHEEAKRLMQKEDDSDIN